MKMHLYFQRDKFYDLVESKWITIFFRKHHHLCFPLSKVSFVSTIKLSAEGKVPI